MQNEAAMLLNWLSLNIFSNWKSLYHPSKGADTIQECMNACFNKSSIVVLIESNNGGKFGGYTSVGWDMPTHDGLCIQLLFIIH